jgi:anaerobic magnesium-protoporphyrin IX monomethyl ester cyclase
MRHARVLFLTPSYPGRYFGGVRPPVGIGYVEEYVAAHGVATAAVDMNAGYTEADLLRTIADFEPSLLGVTMMTYQYLTTYELIRRVKQRFPALRVVVGGPHVSALEGEVLSQCPEVDYAIAGEGEIPMRELCTGAPLDTIGGLYRWRDGEVVAGVARTYVRDLDQFPFPRFRSYPLHRYTNEIEIATSRGCPHKCIFCSVPNHMGRQIRYRSPENVCAEISYFYDRGVRSFQFGDDNFLAHRGRVPKLLHAIAARNFKGAVLRCGQGIRADLINEDVLRLMRRAGFKQLGIGVESGSDRILKVICKHLTVKQVDSAVALACDLGFDVTLMFIVGTPGETLADVDESIALAKRHPVMKAHFFNLVPFPGTELSEWVDKNAALLGSQAELFNRTDEWKLRAQPFFETPEMPERDRITAAKRTAQASREIQVRTLERKLTRWGVLGKVAAQTGRINAIERLFVRHRRFRDVLDRVVFGEEQTA